MVVRMRVNRSKSGKRRSHHGLTAVRATRCECGALRRPHRACAKCGRYNGKVVVDMTGQVARDARRAKRREKELNASGNSKKSESTAA